MMEPKDLMTSSKYVPGFVTAENLKEGKTKGFTQSSRGR
jgi:hypothetical protein